MKITLIVACIATAFCFSFISSTPTEPQQVFGHSKAIFAHDLLDEEGKSSTANRETDENDLDESMWFGLIRNADLVIEVDEVDLGQFSVQKLFVREPSGSQKELGHKSGIWVCPQKPKVISI